MEPAELEALAERVKRLCLERAEQAYEQAAISGLCGSGAWEVARGAVKSIDIPLLVQSFLDESR